LDISCFRIDSDPEGQIRHNYSVIPGSIADKIATAIKDGRIDPDLSFEFVGQARLVENETTFLLFGQIIYNIYLFKKMYYYNV
jgi:hypothetical protein